MADKYAAFEVDLTDGVKIYIEKEWVHLRKSNTEPIIRIYSESSDLQAANALAEKIIGEIKSLIWYLLNLFRIDLYQCKN